MWVRIEAKLLKSLGAIFYTVQDDLVLDFTSMGLKFRRVDPAHVYLADVIVTPQAFNRYDRSITDDIRVVIDGDDLKSFLKTVKDIELVTITNTDDGHLIFATDRTERTIRTMDNTGYDPPHIPALSADCIFRVHVSDLKNGVKLADDVSDHVIIEVTKGLIRMFATGMNDTKVEYKIPNRSISINADVDIVKSMYSIEYLNTILKSIPSSVKVVKVHMRTNYPIKIEYTFGTFTKKDVVIVRAMMAPRLENGGESTPTRTWVPPHTPGNPMLKPEVANRDNTWRV